MSVEVGSLTQLEPLLDAVPTPVMLIEPGTARVLYINPAAHRLAGGRMDKAEDADYASVYGVFDPETGRRLASDEHPGVRAAARRVLPERPGRLGHAGGRTALDRRLGEHRPARRGAARWRC